MVEAIQKVNIIRHLLQDDGVYPNNALLPLIVYQKALLLPESDADKKLIDLLETNDWVDSWVDSIYDYHHYHSTAHEVLGAIEGSARVKFGGPNGPAILLEKGDVVVIPAGVAHKAIDLYDNFQCVGAYPSGQDFDIMADKPGQRERAIENIRELALPTSDPIYGLDGPLLTNWIQ